MEGLGAGGRAEATARPALARGLNRRGGGGLAKQALGEGRAEGQTVTSGVHCGGMQGPDRDGQCF